MDDPLFTTSAGHRRLETEILPGWMPQQRWFAGKGRNVERLRIVRHAELGGACLLAVDVTYESGANDVYCVPVSAVTTPPTGASIIARLAQDRVVIDAVHDPGFRDALYKLMATGETQDHLRGQRGEILTAMFPHMECPPSRVLAAEQSNTSLIYGDKLFVKLYRRVAPGENPDAEITHFLSAEPPFRWAPAFGGAIQWVDASLALALELRPNEGNAWDLALEHFGRFVEDDGALEEWERMAFLLGRRTGLFHGALIRGFDAGAASTRSRAAVDLRAAFLPEWMTQERWQTWLQNVDALSVEAESLLNDLYDARAELPPQIQDELRALAHEKQGIGKVPVAWLKIIQDLKRLDLESQPVLLTRTHGDYHLGQVLCSEGDFVLIDFEGEPSRSLEERRAKQPPIRDVAGMLRSFHYAAHAARGSASIQHAETWASASQHAFLEGWRETVAELPIKDERLLPFYLLEKLIYELRYEWNNRPDWLHIPLRGLYAPLPS
jgi:trehalose synthase-fused probable maltokinase